MCGIAGFIYFDKGRPAQSERLRPMTDIIRHRGPDGEGFYIKNNVALGHRRLSIIDLNTGDQPMINVGNKNVIVFNGEIYNYLELKEELKSLGHVFYTTSDTEVILKAYDQWGVNCLSKFNGCWAFALWDELNQFLFISRDRIGEKPLHYTIYDNTFIFGSEIKSLFQYGVPKKLNLELLDIYLTLCYIPAPYSFFENIKKVKPGYYHIIKDGTVNEYKYWDLPEIDEKNMLQDKPKIYSEFASLLYDSIKIRLRSDVPFGAFLSGGLDSSCIVALMSEISKFPVETFTIGFADKAFDERHLADQVAKKFNTNHHVKMVEPVSFTEALNKIIFHYDEPFGDSSAIPTGYVSEYAREYVKMVLTGDGGDEVLCGYTAFQGEKFSTKYQKYTPRIIANHLPSLIGGASSLFSNKIRYKLNRIKNVCESSNLDFIDRRISKSAWTEISLVKKLIGNIPVYPMKDFLQDFFKNCSYKDNFYKLMYYNLKLSLPDDMLVKVDRMSLAYSLEARVPFLDHRLIDYMCQVHKDVKMQGYERKSVLRNTVGQKLPPDLLSAPKKGFGVPLREWFKDSTFSEKLNSLIQGNLPFDKKELQLIIDQNNRGEKDYGNFIWMLFVLNENCKNSN